MLRRFKTVCSLLGCTPCTWVYTLHCGVPPTCTAAYILHYWCLPLSRPAMQFTACFALQPIASCTAAYRLLHCGVRSHPCSAAYPPLQLRCVCFLRKCRGYAPIHFFYVCFFVFFHVSSTSAGTPQCTFYLVFMMYTFAQLQGVPLHYSFVFSDFVH